MKPQLTIALQTILLVAVNSREVTKREVTDTLKSNEALDFKCVLRKCMKQFTNCAADRACRDAMGCTAQCTKPDAKPGCVFDCGYFNEEIPLVQFTDCLAMNNCSETTTFGRCVGEDSDADQSITSISESNGVYWNVKGLNCGQDTIGEGFDNVACNKIEIDADEEALEGEAQYSACFDSGCMTVNQTLTFRAPGVFLSKGFWGQSKVPIYDRMRVLAKVGDYGLVSRCSRAKLYRFHSLLVISKSKTFNPSPEELAILKAAAAKQGIDLEKDMCTNDQSSCN